MAGIQVVPGTEVVGDLIIKELKRQGPAFAFGR